MTLSAYTYTQQLYFEQHFLGELSSYECLATLDKVDLFKIHYFFLKKLTIIKEIARE